MNKKERIFASLDVMPIYISACRIMRMELMSLISQAQNVHVYVYVRAMSTMYEKN